MTNLTTKDIEEFINNQLKEDLALYDRYINNYNEEIMEFIQLKNTIETLKDNLPDGYKTQMNIGSNIFMEAKVDSLDKIYIDVGKSCFVEFNLEEALKFIEFKVKILTKECDVLREASLKKRSDIKLALMCIAEKERLHMEAAD